MTFTHVAGSAANTLGTTSLSPTSAYATNVTAGSLLVACVYVSYGGSTPGTFSTMTDTLGNTWQTAKAGAVVSFGTVSAATAHCATDVWYCASSIASGANTVTLNLSATPTPDHSAIHVHEFTTTNLNGAVSTTGGHASNLTANGTSQAVATGGSATIHDLVVGVYGLTNTSSDTIGNSSSYTNSIQQVGTAGINTTSAYLLSATSTAVQTCTFTWTAYKGSLGSIASFTESAAAISTKLAAPKGQVLYITAAERAANW